MDFWKTAAGICMGITTLCSVFTLGLRYEEWHRTKYQARKEGDVTPTTPVEPRFPKLRNFLSSVIGISTVLFMISGYLWLSDINRAVDKRLRDSEGDRLAGLHTIAEPNFTCMIGMAIPGITTAGTNNEEKTTITLLMRLSNQGAQSVAWNWHLKAKVTGEDLDADGDDSLSTIYNPGGPSNLAKLGPESNLSRLFAENPMATGAAKTGWVSFPFSRQQYDEPGRSGVVYIVSFLDSHFKIYSAQMTNLASQKSPNYGPLPIPAK